MKIVTIIGTRPQFIKMPLLSQKLKLNNIDEVVIHSGQHFDNNMSANIFTNLNISLPKYQIDCKNVSNKLGYMIIKISEIILIEKPDYVMVFGDCDTTLAGSLAANKLDIPIIHIESGLRSYDRSMPEEINRILVDNLSKILFCVNDNSIKNLNKEGIYKNIYCVGDLMIELLRYKKNIIKSDTKLLDKYHLKKNNYYLLTIHRKANSNIETMQYIFNELAKLDKNILFPAHPRIKPLLDKIHLSNNIILIDPLTYIDMMILLYNCCKLITDSGGLQKEAYELKKPCITLRNNTEWMETIDMGKNMLLTKDIYNGIINFNPNNNYKNLYKNNTSDNIINILTKLNNNKI